MNIIHTSTNYGKPIACDIACGIHAEADCPECQREYGFESFDHRRNAQRICDGHIDEVIESAFAHFADETDTPRTELKRAFDRYLERQIEAGLVKAMPTLVKVLRGAQ